MTAGMTPLPQLNILEYNRVVKDLNGLTPDEFLDELKKTWEVCLGQAGSGIRVAELSYR